MSRDVTGPPGRRNIIVATGDVRVASRIAAALDEGIVGDVGFVMLVDDLKSAAYPGTTILIDPAFLARRQDVMSDLEASGARVIWIRGKLETMFRQAIQSAFAGTGSAG